MGFELPCKDCISKRWKHPLSRMERIVKGHNLAMWLDQILPIRLPVGHSQFCNCISLIPCVFLLAFTQSI